MTCPHCGQTHPPGVRFCPNKGQPMPGAQTCPHCGEKIEANWEVCAYCGRSLKRKSGLSGFNPIYWPLWLVLVGLVAFGTYWFLRPKPPIPSGTPTPERPTSPTVTFTSAPRILLPTATGGKIAFVANINGNWQVFVANPDGTDVQQLTTLPQPGAGDPAISPDGTTIAFVNDAKNIYTIRADGSDLKVIYRDEVETGWPSWSPDSKKIVFASRRNGSLDLFTMNPDGTELVQITDDPAMDQDPVFSPDGTRIAFSSNRSGAWEIYILTLASGEIEQITDLGDPNGTGWPAWSPDGLSIAFESIGEANSRDIYTIRPDGTQLRNVTIDPAYDGAPVWSPDGKQLAFVSDRDNALNLYIMQNDGARLQRLTELWAWGPSWSMTALPETSSPTSSTTPEEPQWINQLSSNPIVPGVGLAGIELGYTEEKVIDMLGNPAEDAFPVKDVNGKLLFYAVRYDYNGLFLGVYTTPDTRTVWSIRLNDSGFNKDGFIPFLQGITIGSSEADLLRSFGQPLSKDEHSTCPENLGSNRSTTTFKFNGISFWVCEANKLVYLIDIP